MYLKKIDLCNHIRDIFSKNLVISRFEISKGKNYNKLHYITSRIKTFYHYFMQLSILNDTVTQYSQISSHGNS